MRRQWANKSKLPGEAAFLGALTMGMSNTSELLQVKNGFPKKVLLDAAGQAA